MNTGMSETLDDALSILKALLQGDEVSRSRNTSLKRTRSQSPT